MAVFGTGPAKRLGKWDIARICVEHAWHPAVLGAIAKAESGGFGWFKDGRIKMLPEPHIFLRKLPKEKRSEARRLKLANTASFKATRASGHYRRMKGAAPRFDLFEKWRAFDEEAAFASCSWGTYQIMGFNHRICGYPTAKAMVLDFLNGEKVQLKAFVNFLLKKKLKIAIRNKDFALIETRYNGGGQGGAYARIMWSHYKRLVAGKWKNWDPKAVPMKGEERRIPPPAPKENEAPFVLGDSLAGQIGGAFYGFSQGASGHTNKNGNGHTVVGASPKAVASYLQGALERNTPSRAKIDRDGIVISPGLSNAPSQWEYAQRSIALLKNAGVDFRVLGVAWGIDGFEKLNADMQALAGARFIPLEGIKADKVHLSAKGVQNAVKRIRVPVVVEKERVEVPVAPEGLGKPQWKSKTMWFTWLSKIKEAVGLAITWFSDLPIGAKITISVILVAFVVAAYLVMKDRKGWIKWVKDLKADARELAS